MFWTCQLVIRATRDNRNVELRDGLIMQNGPQRTGAEHIRLNLHDGICRHTMRPEFRRERLSACRILIRQCQPCASRRQMPRKTSANASHALNGDMNARHIILAQRPLHSGLHAQKHAQGR